MQHGTHISEQDLLNEIHLAVLDVAATSAHLGRRLLEARRGRPQPVEAPPIGEAAQRPA